MIPSSPALAIIKSVPHILAYCLAFLQKLGIKIGFTYGGAT